ncbi:MAG: class I SAM-dependent methyltransferase [Bacteroidia bacterium]|nr:class I SAM-dependent methyltransferase [Bacteroidia bacterium]
MYNYRKTLYQNYYSTHSGKTDQSVQIQHFNQQKRYFKMEFEKHMPSNKQAAVLDIGCGTGSLLKGLQELGYSNLRGIDLSEEQVRMSKTFGVDVVEQNAAHEFLSDKKAEYDVIFAVDLIEHLGKDELIDFLSLVKSSLKPGGKAIFRTPNMDAPLASVFAFADFTHEVFLNKSSATQVMLANGFQDVEVSEGIVYIENPLKEIVRKLGWGITKFALRLQLFFSARTWDDVVFTPNIVITGKN